jgi:hypothetical protein
MIGLSNVIEMTGLVDWGEELIETSEGKGETMIELDIFIDWIKLPD